MSYKYCDYRHFKADINGNNYHFTCCAQNTSYGFRHLCFYQNRLISKACYYNRTWESFEYETVLRKAINKLDVSALEKELLKKQLIDRVSQEEHERCEKVFNDFMEVWNKTSQHTKDTLSNSGLHLETLEDAENLTKSLKLLNIINGGV